MNDTFGKFKKSNLGLTVLVMMITHLQNHAEDNGDLHLTLFCYNRWKCLTILHQEQQHFVMVQQM